MNVSSTWRYYTLLLSVSRRPAADLTMQRGASERHSRQVGCQNTIPQFIFPGLRTFSEAARRDPQPLLNGFDLVVVGAVLL